MTLSAENKKVAEFKKVLPKVEMILSTSQRVRDCDKYLTLRVFQMCLGQTGSTVVFDMEQITPAEFEALPAFATIKRTRAHLQNKLGKYPASPEVQAARDRNRKAANKMFSEDLF